MAGIRFCLGFGLGFVLGHSRNAIQIEAERVFRACLYSVFPLGLKSLILGNLRLGNSVFLSLVNRPFAFRAIESRLPIFFVGSLLFVVESLLEGRIAGKLPANLAHQTPEPCAHALPERLESGFGLVARIRGDVERGLEVGVADQRFVNRAGFRLALSRIFRRRLCAVARQEVGRGPIRRLRLTLKVGLEGRFSPSLRLGRGLGLIRRRALPH